MKRILLLILGSFAFYFLLAQDYRADVQTPKGSNVAAWITYESSVSQQGWFISKWNEYPLMKHRWNDSPYGSSNLKYYRRNVPQYSISDPATISSQATYTIHNLPPGCCGIPKVKKNDDNACLYSFGLK